MVHDQSRHYKLKVTEATEKSKASTVVNVEEVCGQLAGFQHFQMSSEFLDTDIPDHPWQVIHMDWVTGFEKSPESLDAVFVDTLTRVRTRTTTKIASNVT